MSTPVWADVLAWTKSEIEVARTALETETDFQRAAGLRARIAVLRDLQRLKDTPKAPEIPGPVPY